MKRKKQEEPARRCKECFHEWACQLHTVGVIHEMDATRCPEFTTLTEILEDYAKIFGWEKRK